MLNSERRYPCRIDMSSSNRKITDETLALVALSSGPTADNCNPHMRARIRRTRHSTMGPNSPISSAEPLEDAHNPHMRYLRDRAVVPFR
jgi:hypothetical protein